MNDTLYLHFVLEDALLPIFFEKVLDFVIAYEKISKLQFENLINHQYIYT